VKIRILDDNEVIISCSYYEATIIKRVLEYARGGAGVADIEDLLLPGLIYQLHDAGIDESKIGVNNGRDRL